MAHLRLIYTLSPINVLHPHVIKNGGSMLTLAPKCPNMVFATAIRRVVSDASVPSSGMLSSLNARSFLSTASLNSPSSGAALAEKLQRPRQNGARGEKGVKGRPTSCH